MALAVIFSPKSLTKELYTNAVQRLQAAGHGDPKGRTFHVCYGSGDKLTVFEVWDSPADFEAFGAALMPILTEVGIEPGEPQIAPVVA